MNCRHILQYVVSSKRIEALCWEVTTLVLKKRIVMPNDLTPPQPARFNLKSFAKLLPDRYHIVGEDLESFDGFRDGMMQSLTPVTPYECVIAENLIAIEWELLQHRRMRDAGLHRIIRKYICDAVVARERAKYDVALDQHIKSHIDSGADEVDWVVPFPFDQKGAVKLGNALATKAESGWPDDVAAAETEIEALGLETVDLMAEAYRSSDRMVTRHDAKMQELERRRREVKRDFDALQKKRPQEPEIIEGEVVRT